MLSLAAFLWDATRGYRWRPWKSPYLRWRIETYSGIPAESIDLYAFLRFTVDRRWEMLRFARWAARMRRA